MAKTRKSSPFQGFQKRGEINHPSLLKPFALLYNPVLMETPEGLEEKSLDIRLVCGVLLRRPKKRRDLSLNEERSISC
jgi:hypothetical protein